LPDGGTISIVGMPRIPNESIAAWYERAIVADSLAADELQRMKESAVPFNDHATEAITRRARNAEKDLAAALKAYTDQRGPDAGQGGRRVSTFTNAAVQ
jgi:hypothetical protein